MRKLEILVWNDFGTPGFLKFISRGLKHSSLHTLQGWHYQRKEETMKNAIKLGAVLTLAAMMAACNAGGSQIGNNPSSAEVNATASAMTDELVSSSSQVTLENSINS